jgi:aspartate carbamoyltransferase regulatory subunit
MPKIKTLQLLNLVKVNENSFRLTLQINSRTKIFPVKFEQDFVPRMFNVDDDLRQILVGNPQATQEIIQNISEINNDKILIFPIALSVWQTVSELQTV